MPGFDGTGPVGVGPLTGRRRGRCSSDAEPGRAFCGAQPIRRGSGIGGYGRGHRWQYLETGLPRWASTTAMEPPFRTQDMAALQTALEQELKALEEQLNDVKSYLESLKLNDEKIEEVNSDTTLERSE
jgi:hypothetical protein